MASSSSRNAAYSASNAKPASHSSAEGSASTHATACWSVMPVSARL